MNISELKAVSPITYNLFRAFSCMQRLSLSNHLFRTRADIQTHEKSDNWTIIAKRGPQIDGYIMCWLAFELLAIIFGRHLPTIGQIILALFVFYRLLEMFQALINIAIFDRIRIRNRPHRVASHARIVVLTILNYFELWLSFAVLYSLTLFPFNRMTDWIDPLYYSAVVQLTIGFGDITPDSFSKLLAIGHGFFSFLITVLVISRVVAFLPPTISVLDEEDSSK
jgi:hypothetical protein